MLKWQVTPSPLSVKTSSGYLSDNSLDIPFYTRRRIYDGNLQFVDDRHVHFTMFSYEPEHIKFIEKGKNVSEKVGFLVQKEKSKSDRYGLNKIDENPDSDISCVKKNLCHCSSKSVPDLSKPENKVDIGYVNYGVVEDFCCVDNAEDVLQRIKNATEELRNWVEV